MTWTLFIQKTENLAKAKENPKGILTEVVEGKVKTDLGKLVLESLPLDLMLFVECYGKWNEYLRINDDDAKICGMFTDGGAGPGDPWAGGGPPGPLQPSSGASYSGGYSGPPQNSQAPYSSNNIHLPHDSIVSTFFTQQILVKVRKRRAGYWTFICEGERGL